MVDFASMFSSLLLPGQHGPLLTTTVEPLKEDPPIKRQCILYLSTMDKIKSPNFIPINMMRLEPLKEDNLYTAENPLEFILVPKCFFLSEVSVYM